MIRSATEADSDAICKIYNHYVEKTVISFEETPVSPPEMQERIRRVTAGGPWIIWEEGDTILGYAYAGIWQTRIAYRHSVESTVYLAPNSTGRGIGTKLYHHLLEELRRSDVHVVIGGVSLPNPTSVALHEKMGFKKVAHYREVGRKFDQWIDVGYWQLIL